MALRKPLRLLSGARAEQVIQDLSVYNSGGLISNGGDIKAWVGTVTADANGDFTANWSSAEFTTPPFAVMATALGASAATVTDRVWATMRSGHTATSGSGYALRGSSTGVLIGGTINSVRTAPGTTVQIMAWGF